MQVHLDIHVFVHKSNKKTKFYNLIKEKKNILEILLTDLC